MENPYFRKKLIYSEINQMKRELIKNNEFIRSLHKNNDKLIADIKSKLNEVQEISEQMLVKETEFLIENNL